MSRKEWLAPLAAGIVGIVLSCCAFWLAERADMDRVRNILEFRADWRTRDLEAKVRLTGNPVENVAIAMTANQFLRPNEFQQVAAHARHGLSHINSLQWAPRVKQKDVFGFEAGARALGLKDYRMSDISADFKRQPLMDRPEYFPVLFEARFNDNLSTLGIALGRLDDRRIPMERARDMGVLSATKPVRPIAPTGSELVYIVYWPVYDSLDVPDTVEDRRARLRGYATGNYDLIAMLNAAIADTPEMVETLRFAVSHEHQDDSLGAAVAYYSPTARRVEIGVPSDDAPPALRVAREFVVFDQHWDLTYDFSPQVVGELRSRAAWVWLVSGLLLTAWLVAYLGRLGIRRRQVEAIVEARTRELKRTSEQLHQAQKMEAIGNMTGGMAHDFNNLLAVVIGNLDLLNDRIGDDAEGKVLVEEALQASERGAELTRQLLAFARRQPLAPKIVAVNELVVGMTRLLERILEEHIEVVLITAPDVWPVMIDSAQLSTAIANLATNARDAMPKGGRLTIETKNTELDADYAAANPEAVPGEYVLLEVSDTGIGMSPEILAQVFEPFFTTKEIGQGTGLGLSMVFGFVKQSQGHIKIYSEVGHGTIVRIYLPRAAEVGTLPTASVPTHIDVPRDESILVVEDNDGVRNVVSKQLRELGYKVIEADRPQRALELLADPQLHVDLLFTDLVMPDMNGAELAEAALKLRPELKLLFTSGYSGSALLNDARLKDRGLFLSKPYRKQDLARKLHEILGT
ncbi:MAG TPA: CHASE domain-containing protein [Dongiaceae bacterium]|nr:CHASE domain-containing protein [Dongiaceae bacterium]